MQKDVNAKMIQLGKEFSYHVRTEDMKFRVKNNIKDNNNK